MEQTGSISFTHWLTCYPQLLIDSPPDPHRQTSAVCGQRLSVSLPYVPWTPKQSLGQCIHKITINVKIMLWWAIRVEGGWNQENFVRIIFKIQCPQTVRNSDCYCVNGQRSKVKVARRQHRLLSNSSYRGLAFSKKTFNTGIKDIKKIIGLIWNIPRPCSYLHV